MRRFWRYVARGQACAPSGENQIGDVVIAPLGQRADDVHGFVGDELARRQLVLARRDPGNDGLAGRVLPFALRTGATDRTASDAYHSTTYPSLPSWGIR